MSALMKAGSGPSFSLPPSGKQQLRRDRWTAFAVLAAIIVAMTLLVWLASLGGGGGYEAIDYWPMMP